MPQVFVSPDEIAAFLGVSGTTVRRWIKQGELKAYRAGDRYLVRFPDLARFLDIGLEQLMEDWEYWHR